MTTKMKKQDELKEMTKHSRKRVKK